MTTWGDVEIGTFLQGDRDIIWKVADEKDGWVLLVNYAGEQRPIVRPAHNQLVSIVPPEEAEAISVAQHHLGAVVIPDQGVSGGHLAARFPQQ